MIWAIAVRNLWQHKTKTLIIGMLITIGITLMFAGNALIDSMIRNSSSIFTDYYTGDVLVTSTETMGAGVFGAQSNDAFGFPVIPVLRDYEQVAEKVSVLKGVKGVTRQLSGYALFNLSNHGAEMEGSMDYGLFFGVEPDSYFKVMDGIKLVSGRLLQGDEKGIILGYQTWKKFKDDKNLELKVGDILQLNSFGSAGMKILELPIVGIYKFPKGNERLFPMSYIDARSLRYMLGRSGGVAEKVSVSKDATALLDSSSDIDSMFSDDSSVAAKSAGNSAAASGTVSSSNVYDILGDSKPVVATDTSEDSWHFILIRTEKGVSSNSVIKQLNNSLDDADLLARSQGWWVSAMPDSATYTGVQLLFNVAIFILGFVAIIIIMNTLVVSVMERTSEIGTMRALGAQKGFIKRMFIAETGFITLVFGAIGLVLGALIILVLNRIGISTDNDALRFLGGGGILRPTITSSPITMSLVFMCIVAGFSWMYPVSIALKVSPLKAITTD